MAKLPLAVDIADAVEEASESGEPMDIAETAEQLVEKHPEADADRPEVADVLQDAVHAHLPDVKPAS